MNHQAAAKVHSSLFLLFRLQIQFAFGTSYRSHRRKVRNRMALPLLLRTFALLS